MQVIVGKDCGFCRGVRSAIETAENCGHCQTFGKLIHNETVLKELEEKGIFAIENLDEFNAKTLIIRSHGVGKNIYDELEKRKINFIDATCIFVKKIHEIVAENYADGKKIIIIGNPNHPEVIGINGWCENSALIVEKESDIILDFNAYYCVVCQTTFDINKYKNFVKIIENCCKTVVIHNTICYTTINRQKQAETLSKNCDCMLVLGSHNSSNTEKLYQICLTNCAKTYLIQTISDLKSVWVAKNINKLGIIAGASTPDELIREVQTLMSESQDNNKIEKTTANVESFADLLNKSTAKTMDVKAGKLYKDCKIINATDEGITISFGGKKDGFIEKADVELDNIEYNPANYNAGDAISAIVIEKSVKSKNNDCISFSKKLVEKRVKELKDSEGLLKGNEFKATIEAAVKGGLNAKVGPFSIFVPASQIRMGYVTEDDLKKYVGKTLRLRVIKGKKDSEEGEVELKRNKSVIASQRVILEEEKAAKEEAIWATLEVGKVVSGKVKRFAEFGAFVSVNGFDCLAHISDISHYKIDKPDEVLEIGKTYDFVVLKADRETQKVSLGYKQLQKRPYEIALEKYPVGSVITGKVRSVFPYGAFVLIERDVDGLVPVSEISHSYTKNAADALKEDDEITAQVIKFEGNKITLSMKALIPKEVVEKSNEVEASDSDYQESKDKRNQKFAKKFDKTQSNSAPAARRPRAKKEETEEVSSWTSEQSTATFGDLFKGLKFDVTDEE